MARAAKVTTAAEAVDAAPVLVPDAPAAASIDTSSIEMINNGWGLPKYLRHWEQTLIDLKAPFNPEDVKFLPQTIDYKNNTAIAAAYADSRVYTARMNEVIGQGFWQKETTRIEIAPFTKLIKERIDYQTKAVISPASQISAHKAGAVVRVGIFMGPVMGWVYQDSTGAKDTADENWITTAEAQAYKRACSMWGPGNYFYAFGKMSYGYSSKTGKWLQQPQIPDWAFPVKYCNDCGDQLVSFSYAGEDGVTQFMHSWDVYQRTMTTYGVALCPACSRARRDASVSPEANSRLTEQAA